MKKVLVAIALGALAGFAPPVGASTPSAKEAKPKSLTELAEEAQDLADILAILNAENRDTPGYALSKTPQYKRWVALKARIAEMKLALPVATIHEVHSPALAVTIGALSWMVPTTVGAVMTGLADHDDAIIGVGLTLLSGGMLFGPSVGHFNVGNSFHAWGMTGIRFGIYATGAGLTFGALAGGGFTVGIIVVTLFGSAAIALSIWDVAQSAKAANKANLRLYRESLEMPVVLPSPTMLRDSQGGYAPGLSLSGHF